MNNVPRSWRPVAGDQPGKTRFNNCDPHSIATYLQSISFFFSRWRHIFRNFYLKRPRANGGVEVPAQEMDRIAAEVALVVRIASAAKHHRVVRDMYSQHLSATASTPATLALVLPCSEFEAFAASVTHFEHTT